MKAVILAGGFGTRISEESGSKPKPMIEVGGRPILWHIMKCYSHYGISDFIICCGYKGYVIKEYFSNYFMHMSDVTFDLENNTVEYHQNRAEPWRVTLIDTGLDTMTGGRLRRVSEHLDTDKPFCFTYGDGVADIDIAALIKFHENHGKAATVTAVKPPGRYGALDISESNSVSRFIEKPRGDGARINGGFFVLHPSVIKLIEADNISWESEPLNALSESGELMAFRHDGFWQPMDTMREKLYLENLIAANTAPWMVWA